MWWNEERLYRNVEVQANVKQQSRLGRRLGGTDAAKVSGYWGDLDLMGWELKYFKRTLSNWCYGAHSHDA